MSTLEMVVPELADHSEIETTVLRTVQRAERSFVFFVQGLLGLRRPDASRLEALQSMRATPCTEHEAKLLAEWCSFRNGHVVQTPLGPLCVQASPDA
jgi:hypothetical protein